MGSGLGKELCGRSDRSSSNASAMLPDLDQATEMHPWFSRNATYHNQLLASSVKGRDNLLQLIIPTMSRKADRINRTKPRPTMRVLPSELPCPVTTSTNSDTSSPPTRSPALINT